jgi:preprotein translocase subunit SecG
MLLLQYFLLFLPQDLTEGDFIFLEKVCGTMLGLFVLFIIFMALASRGEDPRDTDMQKAINLYFAIAKALAKHDFNFKPLSY